MMVLEHGTVIVEDGRLRARHDVEVVGGARVLIVMDQGRHQGRQDLHVVKPVLGGRGEAKRCVY